MEEISLKEIIEILLKQKKMILLTTLVFMAVGFIYIMSSPKKYESTATLLANPITGTSLSNNSQAVENYVSSFNRNTQMDISTYKEQILNLSLLSQTVEELQLTDKNAKLLSPEALKSKLDISIIDKTNLLKVTVTDSDPQVAADTANVLSTLFIEYITELSREQSLMSSKLIEKQLQAESEKLNEKSMELRDYLIDSKSIKELESNITSLIAQISTYKSDLNDLQRKIAADKASLEILAPKIAGVSVTQTETSQQGFTIDIPIKKTDAETRSTSAGHAAKLTVSQDSGTAGTGIEDTLLMMDVSDMQTRLVSNEADHNQLTGQIQSMEQQLALLQSTLAEEQYKYASIERECQLAAESYNAYQQLHKQVVISSAADIGKLNISVSSPALPPGSPTGTSMPLVLSICFVLGLFVSVFFALFKNYWDSAD